MDTRVSLVLSTAGLLALAFITRSLYHGYKLRRVLAGVPGPPSHWFWGHLLILNEAQKAIPKAVHPHSMFLWIKHRYNLPDIYYLSTWPIGPTFLMTSSPEFSNQFIIKPSRPKSLMISDFIHPLGGKNNLVSDDGPLWKTWRAAFNPGFSLTHLLTLMPDVVDHVELFCKLLEEKARDKELFRLEHMATRLTIDIIGKIVMDDTFNSQTREHELVSAFESQVRWLPQGVATNPWELIDFRLPVVQWWNSRIMNKYVGNLMEQRFSTRNKRGKSKYLIDLALEEYLKQKGKSPEQTEGSSKLDPDFKRIATDQVKIFVFAGHDTSSSAICYCLYHLHQHPEALANVRRELDEVFGKDADIGQRLREEPILLNKLEYIMAVIREALRLHPPANAMREGGKDFFVVDPETGAKYPTENMTLFSLAIGSHTNTAHWDDPWVFRPSRWLTSAPAPEGASRDAFFAFSKLPRNCIGQELATLEIRMAVAMVVRKFDFTPGYDEVEKLRGDGSGYSSDTSGIQEAFGEKAYQISLGTAKPREGMPGWVTLVGQ